MRHPPRRFPLPVLAALGAAALTLAAPARAADAPTPPPAPAPAPVPSPAPAPAPALEGAPDAPVAAPARPPLPDGIVARVGHQDVTLDEFRRVLARRVRDELSDPRSGPYTVLQIVIQETVVRQEADRLGIRVTNEDYGRRYDEIDRQVRERTGASQTLADVIKLQKMTPDEFRRRLEDQIRKERIASHPSYLGDHLPADESARLAQVEVVIGQLLQKARVERDGLPEGVVARVGGEAISEDLLGRALYQRLAESEVRRHLREHCLTLLLDAEGLDFAPAQVDATLEEDRPLYERMKVEAIDPQRRALSFDDFLMLRYGAPRDELRTSRYRRGLFALRRRVATAIGEDDVRAAWVRGAQGEYGPSIVVTEILLSFQIPKAVVESTPRRTLEEARRIANDVLRRIHGGEPADAVLDELKARKDRSIVVERRAVVNRGNDLKVWEGVSGLRDGEWSAPIETLSEVHVCRREAARPAPSFEEIRDVVRGHLIDERAQVWLQDAMRDRVQMARP